MQDFIEDLFRISLRLLPLTHLLAKDAPLIFTEECQAFYTLKKALVSALVI
jgi:hypothetical protein